MARTIQDAVNLNTGEKIYFTSHAAATYLTNGKTVQDAIDDLNENQHITSVVIDGLQKSPESNVIDLGYINKQLVITDSDSMALSPNIYYRNNSTSLSTLTITLESVSNDNIINEYFVEFTTNSSETTVSLPSTIKWANGEAPTFEASTTYQISIVNDLGVVTKFK